MATSDETVLITGASGAVGSGVVRKVLEAGYNTRLTVRDEKQIDWLKQVFKPEERVSFVVVPDLLKSGAFDEVVKGVQYVIHTASPIPKPDLERPWKENYIDPAVKSTLEVLESALKEPKIKKVVITSSCISFCPMNRAELGDSRTVNETLGNPPIDENAEFGVPFFAYHASKVASDAATWSFHDTRNPHYAIISIHPDFVYGPHYALKSVKHMDEQHTTSGILWREYNGIQGLLRYQDVDHSVHVDDVGDAHVKALDDKHKDGEKFILSAGEFKWDDLLAYAQNKYPEKNFKLDEIPEAKKPLAEMLYFRMDSSKAERELGIKFKDIYRQFDDLVAHMQTLPAEHEV
ncbi:hypothetical protein DRE_02904 [Drechslerella stenobrocha 248]|uniref:NAD-dependent epimerase/dehydratase domain-containing protein n=1 Tax=Drechslerella stenobrocha 248 TaxID=1043628 RepID=W7HVZ6_9PEZI|nr:hypothetical protein DRE_02904 [Drechslerella stenobrocha 248]